MRVKNSFLSKKVAKIGSKMYSSLEKMSCYNSDNEIVVLKEVELIKITHKYFNGDVISKTYKKVPRTYKVYINFDEWEKMEDINTDSSKVDISSNSY